MAEINPGIAAPERAKRNFVAQDFAPATWQLIEPYYKTLLERPLNSVDELKTWLHDWSELETILDESHRWIYVRTTLDTSDEKAKAEYVNLYKNVVPKTSEFANLLEKKWLASPHVEQLPPDVFFTVLRRARSELALFRQENIPLRSQINLTQSRFNEITGAQSIHYNNAEITLEQAMVYMKSTDRKQRQEVFNKIMERRLQDIQPLDELLSELIQLRHQVAKNAGYNNFLEYSFDAKGRFDYTPSDCLEFHSAVEKVVMPVVNKIAAERKKELGLDVLKPWDMDVDASGKPPLHPFNSAAELVQKTISCFNLLDPYFGQCIEIMEHKKYLDLESRMRKGMGGYNVSMPETGVPFIFMNSTNSETDVKTMVHEGGHAIHAFLMQPLELNLFKAITSETAEVASMGMELLSMEHWDIFYPDMDDLKRAKKNQLQNIVPLLPKVCQGDSFQFWLYTHPNHTIEERRKKWRELHYKYTPSAIDWSGYEATVETSYQKILHFYSLPFYYIEYAFAQLGALALWENFKQNPAKTISDYKKALSLGYTKPIPVFYETAGTKFDFSEKYVAQLMDFLEQELYRL